MLDDQSISVVVLEESVSTTRTGIQIKDDLSVLHLEDQTNNDSGVEDATSR